MAIYKIFPEKSATLYSYYPTLNAGIDEILELSTYTEIDGTYQISRPIIQFPTDEIFSIINNNVSGAAYNAILKLSLAHAAQLPINYIIQCYALAAEWNIGTGRAADSPIITDGVSWKYTNQLSGSIWYVSGSIPPNTDYHDDGTNEGGGLWVTTWSSSQQFTHISSKDIEIDVTSQTNAWYNQDINNYGLILKHENSLEFNSASIELKYFSANTHTIYPPCLEIRWDDWSYNTGSLLVATSPNIITTLANNQSEYQQGSIQRFRINTRDKFPTRAFTPTSVYLVNKALPTTSYYSIKDLDTEEIVVDYDVDYTKISCDSTGNYFDIYMNGLEPERYYQILIKTTIDGTTLVLDDNYYFKVIR